MNLRKSALACAVALAACASVAAIAQSPTAPVRATSELRELSKQGMRSYFRYWCDAFRLPAKSREEIVSSFVAYDDDLLAAALAEGKGVVVALPHMGSWDHAGAWGTLAHQPVVSVAERL